MSLHQYFPFVRHMSLRLYRPQTRLTRHTHPPLLWLLLFPLLLTIQVLARPKMDDSSLHRLLLVQAQRTANRPFLEQAKVVHLAVAPLPEKLRQWGSEALRRRSKSNLQSGRLATRIGRRKEGLTRRYPFLPFLPFLLSLSPLELYLLSTKRPRR